MSRRTNKTARVLHLITGGKGPDPQEIDSSESAEISASDDGKDSLATSDRDRPAKEPLAKDHTETVRDISKDLSQTISEPLASAQETPASEGPSDHARGDEGPTQGTAAHPAPLSKTDAPADPNPAGAPTDDEPAKDPADEPIGQFKKFMSERMANTIREKHSAPIVEILFNDHDPLSDLIRDQLQAEESMTDAVGIGSKMMKEKKQHIEEQEVQPFVTHDASSGKVKIKTSDGSESDELDYKFVNVFEEIVRSKVLDAMQKFGVCTCDRCIVDVVALTVTSLPAKCIVANKDAIFPLLSYYSSKYATAVQTELIKACVKVKENPHHK